MKKVSTLLGGATLLAALILALTGLTSSNSASAQMPIPPARFGGKVALDGVGAPVGTVVIAYIGDVNCGDTETVESGGYAYYSIWVDSASMVTGCGYPGATVHFTIGGKPALQTGSWSNINFNGLDIWNTTNPNQAADPTATPTTVPTATPTTAPTSTPTATPTTAPTSTPTATPTAAATATPANTVTATTTAAATATASGTAGATSTATAAPAGPTSTRVPSSITGTPSTPSSPVAGNTGSSSNNETMLFVIALGIGAVVFALVGASLFRIGR